MLRTLNTESGSVVVQEVIPGANAPEVETNLEQGVFVLSLSDFGERLPLMMGGNVYRDPNFPNLIFEPVDEIGFDPRRTFNIYKGLQLHRFVEISVMVLRETYALNEYMTTDTVKRYFPTVKPEEADTLAQIVSQFISPGMDNFQFSLLKDIFDVWRINHELPTNNQDENEVLSHIWFHKDIETEILKVIANLEHLLKGIKPLEFFPLMWNQIDSGKISPMLAVMFDPRLNVIMEPNGRVCYYLPDGSRLLISVIPDIIAYSEDGLAFNLDIKSAPERQNPAFVDFKRMEYYLSAIQTQSVIRMHANAEGDARDFYYAEYYPWLAEPAQVSVNHIYPTKLIRTSLGEAYTSIPNTYRNKFPFQTRGDITDFNHQDFSLLPDAAQRQSQLLDVVGQRLLDVKPSAWNILSAMKKGSKGKEPKLRTDGELFTDLVEIRKYLRSLNYQDFFAFHNPYGEPPEQIPFFNMDLREC